MKERRLFSRHSIGTRIAALFMLLILVITAVMTYVSISVLTNELLDNATAASFHNISFTAIC